ncbi:MAG: Fe-S cluster assembly protein SufD [Phyllobacteriaceae bacterium]|nr:Fe-S cluster assembly protein SufD [Phyllobacteriaceae bacterium]
MNVVVPLPRTPAETALIDGARRPAAIEALRARGLPTRRVESWHYTDLKTLLRNLPADAATPAALPPVLEGSAVLAIVDGAPRIVAAPAGVDVSALGDAGIAALSAPFGADDAIGQINLAHVADGVRLAVAADATLVAPVEVQFRSGRACHARVSAAFGAASRAVIIERQSGGGFSTAVCDLNIGDGAEISWIVVQERDDKAVHLGQVNATLGTNAKLNLFVVNEGGKLVRQEIHARAAGEGSEFRLRGVNLMAGGAHVDVTMTLTHEVPHTSSTAVVRNIVTGRANGAFQGMIKVARQAQKTDARMACNTLLLSDEGGFSAKPELEIFADDVACGHGATVREIDRNHLFYLMARGVPERESRGLLVKAFVAEIIEELDNEGLVEALEHRLDRWFSAHG